MLNVGKYAEIRSLWWKRVFGLRVDGAIHYPTCRRRIESKKMARKRKGGLKTDVTEHRGRCNIFEFPPKQQARGAGARVGKE